MNNFQPYLWGLVLLFAFGIGVTPSATVASPNHPAAASPHVRIYLDKPLQLRLHQVATLQTAKVKDGALQITFLKVTEDSRCPTNVACVWAGQVSVRVAIAQNGKANRTLTLTRKPGDQRAAIAKGDRYSIQFVDLQPHPKTATPRPANDYTATFTVSPLKQRS